MDKKQLAQHLYMTQGKSQKEIAAEIGVSERTVFAWIHQYAWDKLKLAAYQAPATISANLCSQLIELQDSIAKRETGSRYPTPQEAETTRKLIVCIDKMNKYPSLSQNIQMLETFKNYMRPIDKEFTKQLSDYSERFLAGKSVNGFAPYQMAYGVEQVAPMMAFYQESEIPEPDPIKRGPKNPELHKDDPRTPHHITNPLPLMNPVPCTNVKSCLHPGDCTHPFCERTKEFYNKTSPDPFTRNGIAPIPAMTDEEREKQYHNYMETNGFQSETSQTPSTPAPSQPEETGSIPAIPATASPLPHPSSSPLISASPLPHSATSPLISASPLPHSATSPLNKNKIPCPSFDNCRHVDNCTWPYCNRYYNPIPRESHP